jgi:predicted nucleotidyltransferase
VATVPTAWSQELRALAQRVADALPAAVGQEVVLTGSASRGAADELSDVELLVISAELPPLDVCAAAAEAAGLQDVDTWTPPVSGAWWIGGRVGVVPIELVWWSRAHAEERIAGILAAEIVDYQRLKTAEAMVHGIALRTEGGLAAWQERLARYPPPLARAVIEDAAEIWGGYPATSMLTLTRQGDRLPLVEQLLADAEGVVRIVFALNRVWEPGRKRLAARVEPLAVKPRQLVERIESALLEADPQRALLAMTELAAETVALAPAGPRVDRARRWLAELVELLR